MDVITVKDFIKRLEEANVTVYFEGKRKKKLTGNVAKEYVIKRLTK